MRELQNVLERALIVSGGGRLRLSLADSPSQQAALPRVPARARLAELERDQIAQALKKTCGKIYGPDGAAQLLGMRPTTLSSKISALGISRTSR